MFKRLFLAVALLLLPSIASAEISLLPDATPADVTPPSGWSIIRTQTFESQSLGTSEWTTGGSFSTVKAHSGTYSLASYYQSDQNSLEWGLGASQVGEFSDIYVSYWEWIDSVARFDTEFMLGYVKKTNAEIPYGFHQFLFNYFWPYEAEISPYFNTTTMRYVIQGEGGGRIFAYYDSDKTVPSGAWHQRELWYHPNTPGQSDGFAKIFTDGVLEFSVSNQNLNGTVDMDADNSSNVIVGGLYTKHIWRIGDPYTGTCSPQVGVGSGYDRETNWDSCTCPNQCPPDGKVPKFWRYFDDIIVMKRISSGGGGTDIQPPYTSGFTPGKGATQVPVGTTSQTFTIYDNRTDDDGIDVNTISVTSYFGTKTCTSGLTCSGGSSSYQVTYSGLSLSNDQVVNWSLTVDDLNGNTLTESWSWTVEPSSVGTLGIVSSTPLPSGTVGQAYTYIMAADNGVTPYTWQSGVPPSSIPGAPYQASSSISGVQWDFANEVVSGPDSDRWPSTWGADNNIWTAWGDGGGFYGGSGYCKTRCGVGKVTHTPPATPAMVNVLGCMNDDSGCLSAILPHNPSCDAPNASGQWGWPEALLSVDGTLYLIVAIQDESVYRHSQLLSSIDNGVTWVQEITWDNNVGTFRPYSFVQFGKDYAGSLDNNVYLIGPANATSPTNSNAYNLYMARVPKGSVDTIGSYEYFTGTPASPSWGTWASRTAVLSDATNGLGLTDIVYNPGLDLYIASGIHGPFNNCHPTDTWKCWGDGKNQHLFEAPKPWGPWSTISYVNNWHGFTGGEGWFLKTVFPTKWISQDGTEMYAVWSGQGAYDAWNQVKVTFTLYSGGGLPTGLSMDSDGNISGVPTAPGTYNFNITVNDSESGTDTKGFSMIVNPATGGQQSVNLSGIIDTYINSGSPSSNYSGDIEVKLYQWPDFTVANRWLARLDISPLPSNITIDSATLRGYLVDHDGSGGDNPMKVKAYRITGTLPDISTVTWSSFAGTLTPESSTNVLLTNGAQSFDVTNMMQSAYGEAATYLYIALDGGTQDGVADTNRVFASIDHGTPSWRPFVEVNYTPGANGAPLPSVHAPGKARWKQGRGHFKSWH